MNRLILILTALLFWLSGVAQSTPKTRRTASNSDEAKTQRAISSRFNQGLRAYYTAQYEEAMQYFSGILADAPKHAPSHYMLARVYSGRQQYTEAENELRQAVKLDKDNIWYQVALAQFLQHNRDFSGALPYWEKICRQMPDNVEFLRNLQQCYIECGKPDKAAELLTRIEQLDPSQSVSNSDTPTLGKDAKAKGLEALQSGRYAEAVSLLEEALQQDDTDYDLWSAYAQAVGQSKQWRKLTAKEEDLTTLFPQSAEIIAALANAFLQSGEPEKAIEYYKQAKTFSFDAALTQSIRKGLFDAYTALGDTESAERWR
jgi:tetratricopeptide (TPR) repeat protein